MFRVTPIIFILLLTSLVLQSNVNATNDPELRRILNKHWEAMGGMRNWAKVESIQLNGTIERDGKTVDIVIVKKRPNQIRATVTLPIPGKDDEAFQVIRAHDGKTAWTATRIAGSPEMKKEELSAEAAKELLADAGVLPRLIKLWREGAELQLLENEEVEGKTAFVVQANRTEQKIKTTFYISKDNFRLLAFENKANSGYVNRTTLSDYTEENGIIVSKTRFIESPKTGQSIMKTTSIKIGIGIYEDYFAIDGHIETASKK